MVGHVIEVKLSDAWEVFDTNHRGELLQGERARELIASVRCDITSGDLRVGLPLKVTLSAEADIEGETVGDTLAWHARLAMPDFFGRRDHVNLFHEHRVRLESILDESREAPTDRYSYMQPVETTVSQAFLDSLREEAAKYEAARKAFNEAVSRLKEHSDLWPDGMRSEAGEITAILNYLDECVEAASLGHLYGWYKKKQSRIRITFADLMRRKDPSHRNYKIGKEFIQGALFSYHAPDYWTDSPPLPVLGEVI